MVPTARTEAQHLSRGPWAVLGPRHTRAAPVGSTCRQSPRRRLAHDSSFIPPVREPGVYPVPTPGFSRAFPTGMQVSSQRLPPRDGPPRQQFKVKGGYQHQQFSEDASLEARPVMQEFLTQPEVTQPDLPPKQMREEDKQGLGHSQGEGGVGAATGLHPDQANQLPEKRWRPGWLCSLSGQCLT